MRRRKALSIYQRLEKTKASITPMPIVVHGAKSAQSHMLHTRTETIVNPRISRVQAAIESAKLTAALYGSYSLAANQIAMPMSFFIMHKNAPLGHWFHEKTMEDHCNLPNESIKEIYDENEGLLLNPDDFDLVLNPKLVAQTKTFEHSWEYCLSFPQMRCLVRRPIGI